MPCLPGEAGQSPGQSGVAGGQLQPGPLPSSLYHGMAHSGTGGSPETESQSRGIILLLATASQQECVCVIVPACSHRAAQGVGRLLLVLLLPLLVAARISFVSRIVMEDCSVAE